MQRGCLLRLTQMWLPSGAQTTSWARNGGSDVAEEARPRRRRDVEGCHFLGLRAECRPDTGPGWVDADVARQQPHGLASEDPAAGGVERYDLATSGIGDVRVAAVRMRRGVTRLAKAAEHVCDPTGGPVDEADDSKI